jgi:effector-binding domain-containing protein
MATGSFISRKPLTRFLFFYFPIVLLCSCGAPEDITESGGKKEADTVSVSDSSEKVVAAKYEQFSEAKGGVGVYEVPEMLTLCIRDSADIAGMAAAFAKAYSVLQEEIKKQGLQVNGSPGSIYYNNDPKNFVFECVYPINKVPERQPEKSKVVVLEADNMYIYNYYGTYSNLYMAYEEIRYQLKDRGLAQSGPMREFYVTDAGLVKDTAKWLTRIMVPVKPVKKDLK